MNIGKFIGSTMIVIGSIIGAGMLAFPIVGAAGGFTWSAILMLIFWILAIVTGLLTVETNLALPDHSCSYSSMAEKTLGVFGKVITWLAFLFLLYAIITAYMIGAANTITGTLGPILKVNIPSWISATIFTIILGAAVFWSTQAVDYFNRMFMSLKGLSLLAALSFLTPHMDISKLIPTQNYLSQFHYLWIAVPVFLCAFGYQYVIPSIRIYIGDQPRQLKTIIIISVTVSLLIYLWWLADALGVVPTTGDNSFVSIAGEPPPGRFIQLLAILTNSKWVTTTLNSFVSITLTTSFLGVSLSLFDFLADGFKRPNTRFGRLQTAALTFVPPFIFAILYPAGFIAALNYATIPLAFLTVILPALMAYYLRKNPHLQSPYRVKCNTLVLGIIMLIGVVVMVLALMSNLHLLPELK